MAGMHVYVHALVHEDRVAEAELKLVDEDAAGHIAAEQLNLRGVLIADAEEVHLARGLQAGERLGDLLRLHQGVGPVQQQRIQVFDAQALQRAVHCLEDVLAGRVVMPLADAHLVLQDELFPKAGIALKHFAESLFGLPAAIDVGVIHEVDALFEGGQHDLLRLLNAQRRYAHGL